MNINTTLPSFHTRLGMNPARADRITARRNAMIVRCLTSPKVTEHDRLTVRALINPILGRISRR